MEKNVNDDRKGSRYLQDSQESWRSDLKGEQGLLPLPLGEKIRDNAQRWESKEWPFRSNPQFCSVVKLKKAGYMYTYIRNRSNHEK